ncbi:hypothetical protein M422DRAFT_774072 [Sphaerobolus stellatus SS14]|nr:hypothetical protein M422DRAFT_774072 [Sphaerobolus stellatus SS14]
MGKRVAQPITPVSSLTLTYAAVVAGYSPHDHGENYAIGAATARHYGYWKTISIPDNAANGSSDNRAHSTAQRVTTIAKPFAKPLAGPRLDVIPYGQKLDYTPVPRNGFPVIHGWNVDNVFRHMSEAHRFLWIKAPHPEILVYLSDDGRHTDPMEAAEMLRTLISRILGCNAPNVGAPEPADPTAPSSLYPRCYLVGGLVDSAAERLLRQVYWSTRYLTFFALFFRAFDNKLCLHYNQPQLLPFPQ